MAHPVSAVGLTALQSSPRPFPFWLFPKGVLHLYIIPAAPVSAGHPQESALLHLKIGLQRIIQQISQQSAYLVGPKGQTCQIAQRNLHLNPLPLRSGGLVRQKRVHNQIAALYRQRQRIHILPQYSQIICHLLMLPFLQKEVQQIQMVLEIMPEFSGHLIMVLHALQIHIGLRPSGIAF